MRKKIHLTKELLDNLAEMKTAYIDKETGLEMLNPVPHTLILDDPEPLSMLENMKRFLRNRGVNEELEEQGVETMDDALDLDVPDDMMEQELSKYQPMNDEFIDRNTLDGYRDKLKAAQEELEAEKREFQAYKARIAQEAAAKASSESQEPTSS